MKKKHHVTGSDIKRSYRGAILVAVFVLLFGGCLALTLLTNPVPDYEDLEEFTLTVRDVRHYSSGKGQGYLGIRADNGRLYRLSGEYAETEIREALEEGTVINAKGYKGNILNNRSYIEEIISDGKLLSEYNSGASVRVLALIVFGTAFLISAGFVIFYIYIVRKEIKELPRKYRNM